MTSKTYSGVWNYFRVMENDASKAQCTLCDKVLSRGRSDRPKDFSTSSLLTHLRSQHRRDYNEMLERKSEQESNAASVSSFMVPVLKPNPQQLSISETWDRAKVWDINSSNAQRVHTAIARMIATDMEPYQIVERQGFRNLLKTVEKRYELPSRKYFAETVIPGLCENLRAKIASMVNEATYLSFTTDTWTAEHTTQSFMGLTCHWLTNSFVRHSVVLHCAAFDEHHTANNLLSAFEVMLQKWNIPREKCHVVLRDNAFNIAKCFRDGNYASVGCFAHTLQLCVRDGLLNQKCVTDITGVVRRLVGHFKHSSSATTRLHELQKELGIPEHQLMQDVPTRWNSTFYMLRRILEQRRAVSLYCAEVESVSGLTAQQWTITENAVALLLPFEELTREVSSARASISVVLPMLKSLVAVLQKGGGEAGVISMKAALLEAVNSRFADVEANSLYSCATVLDPRFKQRFCSDTGRSAARAHLLLASTAVAPLADRSGSQQSSSTSANSSDQPMENQTRSSLWNCFETIVHDTSTAAEGTSDEGTSVNAELDQYLSEPLVNRQDDPASWWKMNMHRFPHLSPLAEKFLAPPPTSVPSERLFSTAGDIISDHRSRLLPENAETLIFLKFNGHLLEM